MRQKIEELYGKQAISSQGSDLIKEGCAVLAGAVRGNRWSSLVDSLSSRSIIFSRDQKECVDAALQFLQLSEATNLAPRGDPDRTSQTFITDLINRHAFNVDYISSIHVGNLPYVTWTFDQSMARALEQFLNLRQQKLGILPVV